MKKNVCGIERIVRFLVGITLPGLYFLNAINGVWGIVVLVVGVILLLTSIFQYCPLNAALGINSCRRPLRVLK